MENNRLLEKTKEIRKTLTKKESAELYSMAYPKLHQGVTRGYEIK